MTSFPSLPPIIEPELDEPFWPCPSGAGAGQGGARLRAWAASGGTGHLAVVTEPGSGVSTANSVKDIWDALRARWHGDLTLLEHYPAAGSFPGDGDDLYQAIIGPAGAGPGGRPGRRQLAVRLTAARWALLALVAAAALTACAPISPPPAPVAARSQATSSCPHKTAAQPPAT